MTDKAYLQEVIDEIMSKGYDRKTAGDFAVLIGDTPIMDEDGGSKPRAGSLHIFDGSNTGMNSVVRSRREAPQASRYRHQ